MAYARWCVWFVLCMFMFEVFCQISEKKCAHFEFPTLTDNTLIILNETSKFDVAFKVKKTCNVSTTNFSYLLVEQESKGNVKIHCMFIHNYGDCSSTVIRCRCPVNGSDVYRLELFAESRDPGVWTWSSKPSVVEEHSLVVSVIDEEDTTDTATTDRTPHSDIGTTAFASSASVDWLPPASTNYPAEVANGDEKEKNFFLTQPGIVMLVFNGAVVLAIVSLVVVVIVIRKGRQVTPTPHEDILLQQQLIPEQNQPPPLSQQPQRQLPEIPGQYQVPPRVPSASAAVMPLPCARAAKRYRSQESNLYEVIDDDPKENERGVRACVSAPDLSPQYLPADYLNPIPSEQEATDFRAMNPLYQNYPCFQREPNKK